MNVGEIGVVVYWLAAFTIVYAYVGFPLLLGIRGLLFPKPLVKREIYPSVSIIIAAYNEEDVIEEKIENTLALDYPQELIEIVVASDGSDDSTNELVSRYTDPRVRLMTLPRLGKNRALNKAVADTKGEILVFTDADSMLNGSAIKKLTAHFSDPEVGSVGGDYRYVGNNAEGLGERTYWGIDRTWKLLQNRAGSMTSATGQLFALRKELFAEVPTGVTDDFYCSVQAPAAKLRLVYELGAIACGPTADSMASEYARKVRVMTRGLNSVWQMRRLLNPFVYGFYSIQLFSHKVLRRLVGIPLVLLFLSNLVVLNSGLFYSLTFFLQALFYTMATFGLVVNVPRGWLHKVFNLPAYYVMVNYAGLVAGLNVLRGTDYDVWKTSRAAGPESSGNNAG